MSEYYYFGASLPMLRMNQAPPISYDSFMKACSENLSRHDMADMRLAVLAGGEGDATLSVVRAFRRYASELNKAINHERAKRLGFSGYEKGSDDKSISDRAREIVALSDPLKAEREVLSSYFDFLSSYESISPFSAESLMIYSLKLQIIEVSSSFSPEQGRSEFDKLYKSIEEDIFR